MLFSLRGKEEVRNWDKVPFGRILMHPVVMTPRSNSDSKPLCSVSPNVYWKAWVRERVVDMRGEGSDMRPTTTIQSVYHSEVRLLLVKWHRSFDQRQMKSPPSALVHVKWSDRAFNCIRVRFDVLTWRSLHLGSPAALNIPGVTWLSCVVNERATTSALLKQWRSGDTNAPCEVTLQTALAPPPGSVFPSLLDWLCLSWSALSCMLGSMDEAGMSKRKWFFFFSNF